MGSADFNIIFAILSVMSFSGDNAMGGKLRGWFDTLPSSPSSGQMDKLPKFLSICTYTDQVRPLIEQSARQILTVFPSLTVELLQFYENSFLFRFIEMRGEVAVPYCPPLQLFLMFPPTFPKNAPFFRVVNPNPQQMQLKTAYQQSQSRNDPRSLVLNPFLNEVKSWNASKSVVTIIMEVNNLLRNNYPYLRIDQNTQNYPVWGNYSPRQSPPPPPPPPAPTNNFNNLNNSPPSPNRYHAELLNKTTILITKQRQRLSKISTGYSQLLPKLQDMDALRYSIQSEQNFLTAQNKPLGEIITNSNSSVDFLAIIRPKDRTSEQMLDCFSSIKSRSNVGIFLEDKFYNGEIGLEQFLRVTRKNEESKFVEKYMLVKLMAEKGQ